MNRTALTGIGRGAGNPAAEHAALKALRAGMDTAIDRTAEQTLALAQETGADRWRTPCGTVSVASRAASVAVADETAFVAWVAAVVPTEIVQSVRESSRKHLLQRLVISDDGQTVVDSQTGEVAAFAAVRPGGQKYLTVRDSTDAKRQAEAMVLDHLEEIARLAEPDTTTGRQPRAIAHVVIEDNTGDGVGGRDDS